VEWMNKEQNRGAVDSSNSAPKVSKCVRKRLLQMTEKCEVEQVLDGHSPYIHGSSLISGTVSSLLAFPNGECGART